MSAVVVETLDGPSAARLRRFPVPSHGTPPPYVVGSEVAGVVREGDPESGLEVGDRVAGVVFWGGLAEQCLIAPNYAIRVPAEHPGTLAMVTDAVQTLLHDGRIHPKIGARFPFDQAVDALALVGCGEVTGKIVVDVNPASAAGAGKEHG